MTKNERAKLEELYQDAVRIEHNASPDRGRESRGFCRGYEWGIRCALDALGYSWSELYDLWDAVTHEPTT